MFLNRPFAAENKILSILKFWIMLLQQNLYFSFDLKGNRTDYLQQRDKIPIDLRSVAMNERLLVNDGEVWGHENVNVMVLLIDFVILANLESSNICEKSCRGICAFLFIYPHKDIRPKLIFLLQKEACFIYFSDSLSASCLSVELSAFFNGCVQRPA